MTASVHSIDPNADINRFLSDSADDVTVARATTPIMNAPTREEFEARIEAVEARMDTRVVQMTGELHGFVTEQRARDIERDKRFEERDKRIELLVTNAEQSADVARSLKSSMWAASAAIILAVIGTVVASYFANQQSNLAIVQSVIAAFQQGAQSPSSATNKRGALKP